MGVSLKSDPPSFVGGCRVNGLIQVLLYNKNVQSIIFFLWHIFLDLTSVMVSNTYIFDDMLTYTFYQCQFSRQLEQ